VSPTSFAKSDDVRSWGRVTQEPQQVAYPSFRDQLPALLEDRRFASKLPVGLLRSYGDSCLNGAGALIEMRGLGRFIAFDPETGVLRAEAGVSISGILRLVVRSGWFLPTTPGTRFVTLGGALANDVHGKNHHSAGSLGCHVRSFGLRRSDHGGLIVTPQNEPSLFASTIGGLGLTGLIEWVELQLVKIGSSYLDVETIPYEKLDEFWSLAEESVDTYEHTVAWIDCATRGENSGRGVFSRANWLMDGAYDVHSDRSWKRIPCEAPGAALNRVTVSAFNEVYFRAGKRKAGTARQHYAPFFYPLDAIFDWNRLYGWRGMLQYQCVVPREAQREAIRALLDVIAASGQASFLAVLKTFGERPSPGLLSFPRPGATLALDFRFRGEETLKLFAQLDAIVADAGGALYPAKDGRMSPDMFRRSFPKWGQFMKDPAMDSDFWRRVSQ
jgi:FAD/FMN-containing dehydrogenase